MLNGRFGVQTRTQIICPMSVSFAKKYLNVYFDLRMMGPLTRGPLVYWEEWYELKKNWSNDDFEN